jgi:PKD repeat protein
MFLIMCSVRRTQRTARSWRLICGGAFAGLAVMMAMFAAMGCGGGSTIAQSVPITQPSVTATPAGTYTITLTFTPMATTTSVAPLAAVPPTQLTLIVN